MADKDAIVESGWTKIFTALCGI